MGKIGDRKAKEIKAIKLSWYKRHGRKEEDTWVAFCQSHGPALARGSNLTIGEAQFSHKVGRGRGGDIGGHVQASNGINSCAACHDWLTRWGTSNGALLLLMASSVSYENNGIVAWPDPYWKSLRTYLLRGEYVDPDQFTRTHGKESETPAGS